MRRGGGEPYDDGGALAQAAFDAQAALMKLEDVFDDREAETGAAEFARARAIDAIEALGQPRDIGGRNAFAGVSDDKFDTGASVARGGAGGRRRGSVSASFVGGVSCGGADADAAGAGVGGSGGAGTCGGAEGRRWQNARACSVRDARAAAARTRTVVAGSGDGELKHEL